MNLLDGNEYDDVLIASLLPVCKDYVLLITLLFFFIWLLSMNLSRQT